MQPERGRELDAAIAREVFGGTVICTPNYSSLMYGWRVFTATPEEICLAARAAVRGGKG